MHRILRDFVTAGHQKTERDYLSRVTAIDKTAAAEIACKFGEKYWDGPRELGYGGYRYTGRWRPVAKAMIETYGLKAGDRVLDVGCGKGFLLHDLTVECPGLNVAGIDISEYAITASDVPEDVRQSLIPGDAGEGLPWPSRHFDLVISITTIHNLLLPGVFTALAEIQRVARGDKYVCVEAYQSERQKVNLLYWQLTCRQFKTPKEWEFVFDQTGYNGDVEFIYFD